MISNPRREKYILKFARHYRKDNLISVADETKEERKIIRKPMDEKKILN